VTLPGKNNIGINLHTAFSNNLDEEFVFYPSENLLELDENIDEAIKSKAQEIINDPNSQYKDYPDYYKIGKFVNSHIEYDLNYKGRNLTSLEIFEGKKGVCEHYTILYNAMLNAIGIKTIQIVGWAFNKDTVSGDKNSVVHAWTGALINNKFMELDATWDLFEGISAGHILKAFGKEIYSYTKGMNFSKTHNIYLVENLNDEEEDKTIYNKEIPREKIEETESEEEDNEEVKENKENEKESIEEEQENKEENEEEKEEEKENEDEKENEEEKENKKENEEESKENNKEENDEEKEENEEEKENEKFDIIENKLIKEKNITDILDKITDIIDDDENDINNKAKIIKISNFYFFIFILLFI